MNTSAEPTPSDWAKRARVVESNREETLSSRLPSKVRASGALCARFRGMSGAVASRVPSIIVAKMRVWSPRMRSRLESDVSVERPILGRQAENRLRSRRFF